MDSVPELPSTITETPLTVLIVEDEFLVRWSAAEFLRERGYIVIEATNVADATSIFDLGTSRSHRLFRRAHAWQFLTSHTLGAWLDLHHPDVPLLLHASASATEAGQVTTSEKRRFIAKPYELGEVSAQIESMSQTTAKKI